MSAFQCAFPSCGKLFSRHDNLNQHVSFPYSFFPPCLKRPLIPSLEFSFVFIVRRIKLSKSSQLRLPPVSTVAWHKSNKRPRRSLEKLKLKKKLPKGNEEPKKHESRSTLRLDLSEQRHHLPTNAKRWRVDRARKGGELQSISILRHLATPTAKANLSVSWRQLLPVIKSPLPLDRQLQTPNEL